MKKLMLTLASIGLLNFVNAQTNECTVQITGLKSNTGKCLLYLYKDKKDFQPMPKQPLQQRQ